MRRYETVIFDLDGTLLDTLEDLTDAVNHALGAYNIPLRTIEEIRSFVGNGVRNLMLQAVPNGEKNPSFEEIFALFKEYYGEHCNDKTGPYAGVLALLEELKQQGYVMGIVSELEFRCAIYLGVQIIVIHSDFFLADSLCNLSG